MPELPDVELYLHLLTERLEGATLERVRIVNPFTLRSVDPPIDAIEGRRIVGFSRLGKRIVMALEADAFVVIHLMIAGRFRWSDEVATPKRSRIDLAAFITSAGTLRLTEAGTTKRASLHVVHGAEALAEHDRGGLEVMGCTIDAFRDRLQQENRTLKRALTDPRLFSGIGNAYSDEILHAARLSPIKLTSRLTDDETHRLHVATQQTLRHWIDALRAEFADRFPGAGDVTAFRPDMAVHGKFGEPCPVCGAPVQRIVRAQNEFNYCPGCQTDGTILADRSLSRLLKDERPMTLDDLES